MLTRPSLLLLNSDVVLVACCASIFGARFTLLHLFLVPQCRNVAFVSSHAPTFSNLFWQCLDVGVMLIIVAQEVCFLTYLFLLSSIMCDAYAFHLYSCAWIDDWMCACICRYRWLGEYVSACMAHMHGKM